ncbi:hypothetical protein MMC07_006178 [Pseudocyphellaria aurata]|nr:hypothetical protein [Pseudocyphellaria aurata]
MADSTPKSYHTDPTLYLYTSLTAGSSHIITATSRLETILKANKIPFLALDVATDEKARMLWGRRAGKRKLPGLVRMGMVVGVRMLKYQKAQLFARLKYAQDLEEVEEWNEYGELKDNVGTGVAVPSISTPSAPSTPSKAPQPAETPSKVSISTTIPSRPQQSSTSDSPLTTAMRQAGFEAAKKAGEAKAQSRSKDFEPSKSSNDTLKKLDYSTVTGLPPPTGTSKADSAKTTETESMTTESRTTPRTRGRDISQSRVSKTDGSETSFIRNEKARSQKDEDNEVDEEPFSQKPAAVQPRSQPETSDDGNKSSDHTETKNVSRQGSNPRPGEVDIVKLLKEQRKTGGPLLDLRKLNTGKTAATAATTTEEAYRAQNSGKKTQDQVAGDGEQAGESVGD